MNNLFKILMQGIAAFFLAIFIACGSDDVAGGTVVDPNTMANGSSASAVYEPDIDVDFDPIDRPSLDPSTQGSQVIIVPDDVTDSCRNEFGENVCHDYLFDDDAETFYESEHCKVKVKKGEAMYLYSSVDDVMDSVLISYGDFAVGVVFFSGNQYIRIEETVDGVGGNYGEGRIVLKSKLNSVNRNVCNELMMDMNAFAKDRLDSIEAWGTSGGLSRWSDDCGTDSLSLIWHESILPNADMENQAAEIREYLNKKAEQYKKDCERWETMK